MTARLVAIARHHWAVLDGWAASRLVDPLVMPPDRMLSLVYYWATRNATEQADIDKFNRHLWLPPKGVVPPPHSPWSAESERAAFGSLAAAVGSGKTATREGATVKPAD